LQKTHESFIPLIGGIFLFSKFHGEPLFATQKVCESLIPLFSGIFLKYHFLFCKKRMNRLSLLLAEFFLFSKFHVEPLFATQKVCESLIPLFSGIFLKYHFLFCKKRMNRLSLLLAEFFCFPNSM
jgi:hypothetical protein